MKSLELNVPITWNELSTSQAKNICHALYCNQLALRNNKGNELKKKQINTVTYFIVAKELLKKNGYFKVQKAIKEIRVSAFSNFSNFIYKSVELHRFQESIKIKTGFFKSKIVYGPKFRLKNITIAEFSYADALYYKFKETNKKQYLNMLCASLYRAKRKTPVIIDIREKFNKIEVSENSTLFKALDLKTKLSILYAFEGSRNHIVKLYPNIFPTTKKNEKSTKKTYVPFGKLISSKIDYDISKLETVQNTLVNDFFSVYENELNAIKKLKK